MPENEPGEDRKRSPIGPAFYAVAVGIVGTLLVILFLLTFLHPFKAVAFVPWIYGFTSALTGYNIYQRCENRIKNKAVFFLIAGFCSALLVFLSLNLLFYYLTSGFIFGLKDLLLYCGIGLLFFGLGALLAIKYKEHLLKE